MKTKDAVIKKNINVKKELENQINELNSQVKRIEQVKQDQTLKIKDLENKLEMTKADSIDRVNVENNENRNNCQIKEHKAQIQDQLVQILEFKDLIRDQKNQINQLKNNVCKKCDSISKSISSLKVHPSGPHVVDMSKIKFSKSNLVPNIMTGSK